MSTKRLAAQQGRTWPWWLLALLIILLVSIGTNQAVSWRFASQQKQQLLAQAEDLEQLLVQFTVLPALLSEDPRLTLALQQPTTENLEIADKLLKKLISNSDAAAAFLMNTEGLTLAASNFDQSVSFVGKNYSFRPYFTEAMAGQAASFFAVGATTGIPGYFLSAPINSDKQMIGVIVVKIEPRELPALWRETQSEAVITDELGVVILATSPEFLYSTTAALSNEQQTLTHNQRRYPLDPEKKIQRKSKPRLPSGSNTYWSVFSGDSQTDFLASSSSLGQEPWELTLLYPRRQLLLRTVLITAIGLAALAIVLLAWRNYRQTQALSRNRALQAKELEAVVAKRTRELESVQASLIAESNFSMLGRMSAAINHEINQPLTSLRLNTATLRRLLENQTGSQSQHTGIESDDLQSTVVDIDRTTKRIARVIETLRNLSRHGRSELSPTDIQLLVRESVDTVKLERPIASESLYYIASETILPVLDVNPVLLQQAILNLLYNALDAVLALTNPHVEISTYTTDSTLIIQVMDNGAGVDPKIGERLFQAFESSATKPQGLGLGLTLARQITEDHGGKLSYSRQTRLDDKKTKTIPGYEKDKPATELMDKTRDAGRESSPQAQSVFRISLPITDKPEQRQ